MFEETGTAPAGLIDDRVGTYNLWRSRDSWTGSMLALREGLPFAAGILQEAAQ